jgi:hypothetical protein
MHKNKYFKKKIIKKENELNQNNNHFFLTWKTAPDMAKGAINRTETLGICVTVSAFLKHVRATPPYARTRPPAPSLMPPKYLCL